MDTPKVQKLLSVMYLDIITGDVHIRNQYMNTWLTHIAVYLRMTKLETKQPSIERFRTILHNTVSMILHNYHELPAWDTTRESEIKKLESYFDKFVIKVDSKVADETGIDQLSVIESIETLEYCRNVCYSASTDYSSALSQNPQGLTDASNKFAYIINLVTPIVYRYGMIDISDSDFSKAAAVAAQRNNIKEIPK